jgi:chromosome partitioning protein
MKTIVLANHKGGCAKTTTALNLAVGLALKGERVLVVDLDLQGNLSAALGADLEELEQTKRTVHRLMLDSNGDYTQYLFRNPERPRLDLLPASLDVDVKPSLDALSVNRELRLKNKLVQAKRHYDYCVIDTPPSLGVSTLNGLVMADLVIIPIETSLFALLGLAQLLRTVAEVRLAHSPEQWVMALSTIHNARQNLDKQIRAKVVAKFTEQFVFNTTIPRLVSVGEATARLKAVVESDSDSPATFAFFQLTGEIRSILDDEEERETRNRFSAR